MLLAAYESSLLSPLAISPILPIDSPELVTMVERHLSELVEGMAVLR
jgi:hypothetical protein